MALSKGDRGPDVTSLQEDLNRVGARLKEDGKFGKLTEAAVRTFQDAVGIEADGVVGLGTRLALTAALVMGLQVDFKAGGRKSQSGADLSDEEVARITRCAESLADYTGKVLDSQLSALNRFNNTLDQPAEVRADVLQALGRGFYRFAVDQAKDGLSGPWGLVIDVTESIVDEVRRAGEAEVALTISQWIGDQDRSISNQKSANRVPALFAALNEVVVRAHNRTRILADVDSLATSIGQAQVLSAESTDCRLHEEWINAHFNGDSPNGNGCLVYRWQMFDDDFIDFESLEIAAPKGAQMARQLNRLFASSTADRRRPIEMATRKRVDFVLADLGVVAVTAHGWLDVDNEPLGPLKFVPVEVGDDRAERVAAVFNGQVWRNVDRFTG